MANYTIKNSLHLKFDDYFDGPLNQDSIPAGITHVTFGWNFDHQLNQHSIPSSVTHVTFGWSFNQILHQHAIPENVIHLTFGTCFNQMLNQHSIPSSVTHLTFDWDFNQPLNSLSIPINLEQLNLWNYNCVEIDSEIIDRIKLEINYYHKNIYYDRSRIINLFGYFHNLHIPRTQINQDEFIIKDEWNDYIANRCVTKIKLIPKIIFQSKIKSAKKSTI